MRCTDAEVLEHVVEMLHSRGGAPPEAPATGGKSKNWAKDFDADAVSRLIVLFTQLAGVYACVMSSLLSIFVPQVSSLTPWIYGACTHTPLTHACAVVPSKLAHSSRARVRFV